MKWTKIEFVYMIKNIYFFIFVWYYFVELLIIERGVGYGRFKN